jgi:hypothetical protein
MAVVLTTSREQSHVMDPDIFPMPVKQISWVNAP